MPKPIEGLGEICSWNICLMVIDPNFSPICKMPRDVQLHVQNHSHLGRTAVRFVLTICPSPTKHVVCSQELQGLTPQFLLLFLAWLNYWISWQFAWWGALPAVVPLNLHPAVLTADAGSPLASFFLWLEKVLFGRWAESSCIQPFTFKQQISV